MGGDMTATGVEGCDVTVGIKGSCVTASITIGLEDCLVNSFDE